MVKQFISISLKKILALAFLAISLQAFGQEALIKVEVSSDTLFAGEPFQLRVTIENFQGEYKAPDMSAFRRLGGPNQSTYLSMINGTVKQSAQYTYTLLAEEPGEYRLGSAQCAGPRESLSSPDIILRFGPVREEGGSVEEKWTEVGQGKPADQPVEKLNKRKF